MEPLGTEDPHEISEYRLLARLGEGGMGAVYLSRTRGGQPVAVKVIRGALGRDPEFRRRFEQEVWAARKVRGYHLIAVLDHDVSGGTPWLASEFVAGTSLFETLRAHGPLPLQDVFHLVGCTARALQAIHLAGVVHRDLKPGNIMLSLDGPKVIDFGIAKAADATQLSSGVIGTPQYMSPEHARGERVGPESDFFSLGLIAAVAATGRHPFGEGGGMTVSTRIANADMRPPDLNDYPAELLPLLQRCLTAERSARVGADELMALCRRLSGRDPGDHDGWLPTSVVREIEQRQAEADHPPPPLVDPTVDTGIRSSPSFSPSTAQPTGPAGHAGPGPGTGTASTGPPTGPTVTGAPTGPTGAPGQTAASTTPSRGRAAAPLIAIAAAVTVILGFLLVRPLFDGSDFVVPEDSGSEGAADEGATDERATDDTATSSAEPEYEVLVDAQPLTIRPGTFNGGVDLDVPRMNANDVDYTTDEIYVFPSADRWEFSTTFGVATVTTPEDCFQAARPNALPESLEGADFEVTLPTGSALCTVTDQGNLAMYEITGLTDIDDRYMPEVEGTLTLWRTP